MCYQTGNGSYSMRKEYNYLFFKINTPSLHKTESKKNAIRNNMHKDNTSAIYINNYKTTQQYKKKTHKKAICTKRHIYNTPLYV